METVKQGSAVPADGCPYILATTQEPGGVITFHWGACFSTEQAANEGARALIAAKFAQGVQVYEQRATYFRGER